MLTKTLRGSQRRSAAPTAETEIVMELFPRRLPFLDLSATYRSLLEAVYFSNSFLHHATIATRRTALSSPTTTMGVPTTVLPCWTREQVAARIIAGDNIFILHDKLIRVPNSWLSAHPGGSLSIHHFTGRDATDEVEAFHSDPTLKRMLGYAIGTVSLGEEGWVPLLPPAHAGWIRKIGDDGQLHWHKESTELYSDEPSEESPSSQILLLAKADNPSACPSALTLEPAPTTLSLKQQSQHSAAYKQLHKRIADAGLYKCRYITGYGPEIIRYVIMAIGAYVFYQKQWFLTSAFCLGALWHQLVFTVHDLGHLGVTHDWTTDRAIAIFIANWMGGLSVGWWVAVSTTLRSLRGSFR